MIIINRALELCEGRGGRPGLASLISLRFLWTLSNTQQQHDNNPRSIETMRLKTQANFHVFTTIVRARNNQISFRVFALQYVSHQSKNVQSRKRNLTQAFAELCLAVQQNVGFCAKGTKVMVSVRIVKHVLIWHVAKQRVIW